LESLNKYSLPIKIKNPTSFTDLQLFTQNVKHQVNNVFFLDKSFSIIFGQDKVHLKGNSHCRKTLCSFQVLVRQIFKGGNDKY